MNKQYTIKKYIDLLNPVLGTKIISCSDEFFAPAKRLLNQSEPLFKENIFDNHGKWMDGWETRRKRTKGNDFVIIKLGQPGIIKLINIDTSFFNGNQPEYAQIEGCFSKSNNLNNAKWIKLTKKNKIKANFKNIFKSLNSKTLTHIKLNIYPDGGVARLKLFGNIDLSFIKKNNVNKIDLASITNGTQILACSDEHFGDANNLLLPGKSINMGNGWETRRRRGKGYDWVLIKLGYTGFIHSFEISTHHFKGNYPESFSIQAFKNIKNRSTVSLIKESKNWTTLVKKTKLKANSTIKIRSKKKLNSKFNYIKLNIHPDGGISRLRIFGTI
tara:strand:- start:223 stop:1209 length:987 start_codon:yes stop_codon:yes gene_type:complete